MAAQVQEWLEESPQTRPEDSYVRKPTKFVKCRNERVHASSRQGKETAKQVSWHVVSRQRADNNAATTNLEARFRKLANEWSNEVSVVSSVGGLTSHPKYQEIIRLGWDVVPFLLSDLQRNRGFWFTALNEITGIRPFDLSDAGKSERMAKAWIQWGKRKGII
jgi:hypothetical protein